MLVYLLKTFIIQLIGLAIYYAFLRNEKLFGYARTFLWYIIISSFAIPFVQLSIFRSNEVVTQIYNLPTVAKLSAITVAGGQPQQINWTLWIGVLLGLISLLQLVRLFFSYQKIVALKNTATFTQPNIYASEKIQLPFSFMQSIYIPHSFLNKKELPFILAHEQAHIDKKHSWDKIVITLLARIFWFNPLFILFHKELELVHEYQVDHKVIQKFSREQYLQSLLQSSIYLQSSPIVLTHSFFSSPIKNRIIMLHKKSKNKNFRRLSTVSILLSVLLTVVFLQSQQVNGQVLSGEKKKTEDKTVQFIRNDDGTYTQTITNPSGTVVKTIVQKEEVIRHLNKNTDSNTSWDIDENGVFQLKRTKTISKAESELSKMEDENVVLDFGERGSSSTFDKSGKITKIEITQESGEKVDQPAKYEGGDRAMLDYFAANIKYPKSDKNQARQGTVFIEFVIENDGSVSSAKALNVPNGMDDHAQMAISVIKKMTNWIPAENDGKKVRTSLVLPISFKKRKFIEDVSTYQAPPKKKGFTEAKFPGGEKELVKYLVENLTYPKDAEYRKNPGCKVLVEFVITELGEVKRPMILKSTPGDGVEYFGEALRVIQAMPNWIPAHKENGELVKSKMVLPIVFKPKK